MKHQRLYIRSTLNYDGFPEFAESKGCNISSLRAELGLGPEAFNKQVNIVPWNAICTLYERAATEIDDPNLGLRYALEAKADFSGIAPVVYMGAVSTDVRSFLKTAEQYQAIRTNGMAYSLEENSEAEESLGVYEMSSQSAPYRQILENTLGLAALTARKLIPGFKVKYVSFTHSAPDDISLYEQAFDAPVHFEAERNILASNMDYYNTKGAQLSVGFREFALKAYFKGQVQRLPDARESMGAFISEILPTIIGTNTSDIETFAKSLDMHPKKLQRLLKDDGLSFSHILDNVRKDLAHSLLIDTDLSITHISKILDYSSDRPFTTAFKRWYDMAPTRYRKTLTPKEDLPFF